MEMQLRQLSCVLSFAKTLFDKKGFGELELDATTVAGCLEQVTVTVNDISTDAGVAGCPGL